jgi:tRNA-specific 2-thiouridylase
MGHDNSVLIAMSGGVDSSVAAYLLQSQGYTCAGATMLLHQTEADVADARHVAETMGIPFYVFDGTEPFKAQVLDKFVRTYEAGATPNPCIDCNRHLKFGFFLEKALELGFSYIATGHYARIQRDAYTGRFLLCKAADTAKDQSYFLACLNQQQLRHVQFPLGELSKEETRRIAQEQNLINARKKDSQDICFVPDGDYLAFLSRHTGKVYPQGAFLDMAGNVVGTHQGAVGYTLGQRKGLGVALGEPVYVCAKDMDANTVTVGPNQALLHKTLIGTDWEWYPFPQLSEPIRCLAKTRSRQIEQPATVYPEANGCARVEFDEPQRAITPGQAVVLYDGDIVLGGGTISRIL